MDVPDAIRQKILLRHYNAMKNMRMKDLQDSSSSSSGSNIWRSDSKSCSSCDKGREKHRELAKKMRPLSPTPTPTPTSTQTQTQTQTRADKTPIVLDPKTKTKTTTVSSVLDSSEQDKKQKLMRGDLLHHLREQRNLSLKRNADVQAHSTVPSIKPPPKPIILPPLAPPVVVMTPIAAPLPPVVPTPVVPTPVVPTHPAIVPPHPVVVQRPRQAPLVTPPPVIVPPMKTVQDQALKQHALEQQALDNKVKSQASIPKSLEKEKSHSPLIDSLQQRLQQQRLPKRVRTDRPPIVVPTPLVVPTLVVPTPHQPLSSSQVKVDQTTFYNQNQKKEKVQIVTPPIASSRPSPQKDQRQNQIIIASTAVAHPSSASVPPTAVEKSPIHKTVQVVPGTLEAIAAANQQKSRPTVVITPKQGTRVALQPDRRRKARPISFAVQRLRRPLKR